MKTTNSSLNVTLSKEELEQMAKQVKETLAFGYLEQNRIFSSVDLWNIQRSRRSTYHRKTFS